MPTEHRRAKHRFHYYASVGGLTAAEKLDRGYVGQLLRLILLAPDIAESLLNGRTLPELSLLRLMEPFPTNWAEQRVALGVSASPPTKEHHS